MKLDVGNAPEVPDIARDHNEIMLEGCGSNQEVRLGDKASLSAQHSSSYREAAGDWLADLHNVDSSEEVVVHPFVPHTLAAVVNTFIYLGKSDDADGEIRRQERLDQLNSGNTALEVVSHPITIEQVGQSSTGGRVLLLRSS